MTKPSNAQLRRRVASPLGIMRAVARKQQREILELERKVRELEKARAFLVEASTPEGRRMLKAAMALWRMDWDGMIGPLDRMAPVDREFYRACAAAKAAKGKK